MTCIDEPKRPAPQALRTCSDRSILKSLTLVACLLPAAVAQAADDEPAFQSRVVQGEHPEQSAAARLGADSARLRAFIDPKTRQLRPPTEDELRELSQSQARLLNRSPQGLQVTSHPTGMRSVNLQGRFWNVSVARLGANGALSQACVADLKSAGAFLRSDATAAPLEKE